MPSRTAAVTALQARAESLGAGITRLNATIAQREPHKLRRLPAWQTFSARTLRTSMQTQVTTIDNELATALAATLRPVGSSARPRASSAAARDGWTWPPACWWGRRSGWSLPWRLGRRGRRIGLRFRSSGADRLPVSPSSTRRTSLPTWSETRGSPARLDEI